MSSSPHSFVVALLLGVLLSCSAPAPSLRSALREAGDNRCEIEAFLAYSRRTGDSQKRRAAEFLVRNMPGHVSVCGDWRPYRDSLSAIFRADFPEAEMIARSNRFIAGHPLRLLIFARRSSFGPAVLFLQLDIDVRDRRPDIPALFRTRRLQRHAVRAFFQFGQIDGQSEIFLFYFL